MASFIRLTASLKLLSMISEIFSENISKIRIARLAAENPPQRRIFEIDLKELYPKDSKFKDKIQCYEFKPENDDTNSVVSHTDKFNTNITLKKCANFDNISSSSLNPDVIVAKCKILDFKSENFQKDIITGGYLTSSVILNEFEKEKLEISYTFE